MKLTLTQKGIILVSFPLVFELLFVGTLSYLLAQAEDESHKAFQASRIGDCSNVLIKDMFELTAMTRSDALEALSSNWYGKTISVIRADLNALRAVAKDDPIQKRIVEESVEAGEEAIFLLDQLHKKVESNDILSIVDKVRELRDQLRSCVKRILSRDLMEMALKEKQSAEYSRSKQLTFRSQIKSLLVVGVILNVIIAVLVVIIFSKKIVKRLDTVIDNNFRLASGLPLHPPIGGSDELANLDSTFHELADSLARAKAKEKSIIEHSADVICSLDVDGKVITANPACKRILGYAEDVILGLNLRSILVNDDIESFNQILSDAKSIKTETEFESRINQKNGDSLSIIDVLWSIHWVDSEGSFFCVGHDITQRKELERIKQQFMAMISHDLRTPLTTIGNYLELLGAGILGELTEKGKHLLTIGEQNVNHMLSLINDLLDLEKADFGGLKLDCSAQKLDDLIGQAVKSITNLAASKDIEIAFDSTDLSVLADNRRILQVLTNLLNNAIKFSPKNSKIVIAASQVDNMACVSISDEGRGIPDDMKLAIFERFRQVRSTDATELVGSGLGLAICKAIVELHGGKIQAQDSPSGGSTFSFSLPLVDEEETQAA